MPPHGKQLAFVALLGGAIAIAYAPIAVRLSEVGPTATAFYRLALALPLLWLWASYAKTPPSNCQSTPDEHRTFALAGLLFAADLALWHASIRLTTVANSTLFANFAPFVVTTGAWFLFHERVSRPFLAGMLLAITGASLLVGVSLELSPRHLLGDALGMLTATFYGGYLLAVKTLRSRHSTAVLMFRSGLICTPALLLTALASGESLLPTSTRGWAVLFSLAFFSQILGQSLIAYALAHLPANFSSLGLLLQPVVAAVLAWLLLAEPVTLQQSIGGAIILAGILLARRAQP